jgi:hypothetical protein
MAMKQDTIIDATLIALSADIENWTSALHH